MWGRAPLSSMTSQSAIQFSFKRETLIRPLPHALMLLCTYTLLPYALMSSAFCPYAPVPFFFLLFFPLGGIILSNKSIPLLYIALKRIIFMAIRNRTFWGLAIGVVCGIALDAMKTWCFVKPDNGRFVPLYSVFILIPWPILMLVLVVIPSLIYILSFRKQRHFSDTLVLTLLTVFSMSLTAMLVGMYSGNEPSRCWWYTIPLTVFVFTIFYSIAILVICFFIGYVHGLIRKQGKRRQSVRRDDSHL